MSKQTTKRVLEILLTIVLAFVVGFGIEYIYARNVTRTASIEIETDSPTKVYDSEDIVGTHGETKIDDCLVVNGSDPYFVVQLSGEEKINSAVLRLAKPAERNIAISIYLREKDTTFSEALTFSKVISQGTDCAVFRFPEGRYFQFRIDNEQSLYLDSIETVNGNVLVEYTNQDFQMKRALVLTLLVGIILGIAFGAFLWIKKNGVPSIAGKLIRWNYIAAVIFALLLIYLAKKDFASVKSAINGTCTTFYQQEYGSYIECPLSSKPISFPLEVEANGMISLEICCKTTENNQGSIQYTIYKENEEIVTAGSAEVSTKEEKPTIIISVPKDALLADESYSIGLSSSTSEPISVYQNAEEGLKTVQTFKYTNGSRLLIVVYLIFGVFLVGLILYPFAQKKLSTETIFLILALGIGVIAVFVNPPYNSWDEVRHFTRPWNMTQGNLFTKINESGFPYAEIPADVADLRLLVQTPKFGDFNQARATVFTTKWIRSLSMPRSEEMEWVSQLAVERFSPFVYLPHLLGIALGRLLRLPGVWVLYLARLINMAAAVFIAFLALKKTPAYKNIFILTFFFPALIWSRSSCSTDGVLFSLILMIIAITLETRVKERTDIKDMVVLAVCTGFVALIKLPYVLVSFLALGVSLHTKKGRKIPMLWISSLLVLASIILYFGISSIMSREAIESTSVSLPITKIGRIMQYPRYMLSYFLRYFSSNLENTLDLGINPGDYLILTLCITVLVACTGKELKINGRTNGWYRLLCLAIVFLLVMVIEFIFYEASSDSIKGFQGRYLQPLYPLFLMALCWGNDEGEKIGKTIAFTYSLFLFSTWAFRFIQTYWIG